MDDMTLLKETLVLASKSPRRAQILEAVGWPFEQMPANIDESRRASEDAVNYVRRLAQTKAEAVAKKIQNGLVLGADTVVVVDGIILGQPRDDDDAARMLTMLSGRWHEVVTGVALVRARQKSQPLIDHDMTKVRFGKMQKKEIDWYVATGEPQDKAGAYAVQGKGALFIEEIQGDYFNVMGLPVRLVYEMLNKVNSS
ncbi:MAG: nucleoside triphosphate pyrophosphatase [Pyrinomonadaceae bacterium]